MSEPMQEAVPALVVGSVPAQAWSCGCTVVPMTSPAFAAAFLFFSGAPLFMLFNISISFISPVQKGLRLSYRDRGADAEPLTPIAWEDFQVRSHLSTGLRKPSFNALQIGVYGW
jgi:hypothetical protein